MDDPYSWFLWGMMVVHAIIHTVRDSRVDSELDSLRGQISSLRYEIYATRRGGGRGCTVGMATYGPGGSTNTQLGKLP